MRIVRNRYVFGFHVKLKRIVAAISSDSRSLHPPERRGKMAHILGVHPDHPSLEIARYSVRTADVARPDVTGQPILNVIGDADSLRLILEGDKSQMGTEDLFLRNLHSDGSASVKGWFHVVTHAIHRARAPDDYLGASVARLCRIREHFL